MHRRPFLAGALAAAAMPLLAPARAFAQGDGTTAETVAGVVSNDPELSTLASLLIAADLVDSLHEPGPFTVFAPVDAAFDALGEAALGDLTAEENADRLRRLLMHHVVPDRLTPDDLDPENGHQTLAGTRITITDGETLRIGNAELLQPGLAVPNGMVHKIDSVLEVPEPA